MNREPEYIQTNRRDFLRRALKAGASVAATCSLFAWLYHRSRSGRPSDDKELVTLPDFSIPGFPGKMSIALGENRADTVRRGIEALGGIEAFIKRGDRVLLKVNAAFATPPMLSATTNPLLVAEVARLCYLAGASSVVVTDNPINDPESCFSLSGIAAAARSSGARVLMPRESFFEPTTVPKATLIKNWPILWRPFRGINKIVGIAPVKDHHRSGASMTMKNWYGLLGGRRNIFHQDIHTIITELAVLVRPTFVILDGITTMMTNGPTGGSISDLKQTDTMIVSTDQVAADAFGATLLGKSVTDLPYLAKAEAAGLGTADYELLNPIRLQTG
ncbi:MAG: DUF362 domain-containing protein [Deltaproteobacteria bacterium]|nr:MAG: DUF362 domain-containing protein [Deltaproteobacteria bacterium]